MNKERGRSAGDPEEGPGVSAEADEVVSILPEPRPPAPETPPEPVPPAEPEPDSPALEPAPEPVPPAEPEPDSPALEPAPEPVAPAESEAAGPAEELPPELEPELEPATEPGSEPPPEPRAAPSPPAEAAATAAAGDVVGGGPDVAPAPVELGNGRISGHAILAKLAWAMRSEPGDVRPHNEDFSGAYAPTIPDDAWDRGPFFIVCDGLGGHAAGEVASRTAVESALAHWTTGSAGAPHQAVRAAIRAANVAVFDAALQAHRRGMATTFTGLTIAGREAIVGHVGDSRCYLVRGQTTTQLTNDHSRVGEMLRSGLITAEQAANHPARSMISRTVGSEPGVQVDIIRQPTQAGDTFVLCSDGLWDVVGRREITDIVGAIGTPSVPTVIAAADALIEEALVRNTPDNVTILVVRITTDRPVPAATTKRTFLRRARGVVR